MKIERRAKLRGGINMVPLINIVFLLLIFFMLSSTLVTPDSLELTLPDSASGRDAESQPIVVLVAADGTLAVNNVGIAPSALAGRLAELAGEHPGAGLVIKADATARFAEIGELLRIAQAAGIERIALATQESAP